MAPAGSMRVSVAILSGRFDSAGVAASDPAAFGVADDVHPLDVQRVENVVEPTHQVVGRGDRRGLHTSPGAADRVGGVHAATLAESVDQRVPTGRRPSRGVNEQQRDADLPPGHPNSSRSEPRREIELLERDRPVRRDQVVVALQISIGGLGVRKLLIRCDMADLLYCRGGQAPNHVPERETDRSAGGVTNRRLGRSSNSRRTTRCCLPLAQDEGDRGDGPGCGNGRDDAG